MRTIACLLLLLLLVPTGLAVRLALGQRPASAPATTTETAPADSPGNKPRLRQYLGVGSCSAAACHGAVEPRARGGVRHDEYHIWLEDDPHARAYSALRGPQGTAILERLHVVRDGQVIDPAGWRNCVACHDLDPPPPQQGPNFTHHEGVSCEACHGPAEDWLAGHYTRDFQRLDGPTKHARFGLQPLAAPLDRARACVGCHVGDAQREVNHDLIAAGHPPLKFELTAYLDLLPKHWNDQRQRTRMPDLERRMWLAGQFATAEAALALFEARARRTGEGMWPELAVYDCFGCHQDLASGRWNEVALPPGPRRVGRPRWSDWDTWLLAELAAEDPAGEAFVQQVRGVREKLEERLVPLPDPLAAEAAAAGQALRAWLEASQWHTWLSADPDGSPESRSEITRDLAARLARLRGAPPQPTIRNWDQATQIYLALAAWNIAQQNEAAAKGHSAAGEHRRRLTEVRRLLAFPDGYDSPAQWNRPTADQPPARGADTVRTELQSLLESMFQPHP